MKKKCCAVIYFIKKLTTIQYVYDQNAVIYTYYMDVNHITVTNVMNYF